MSKNIPWDEMPIGAAVWIEPLTLPKVNPDWGYLNENEEWVTDTHGYCWDFDAPTKGLIKIHTPPEHNADTYKTCKLHAPIPPVLSEKKTTEFPKQERYQDGTGEDWIDECARTFTPEEFRGAMKFTIGKYNRRVGKKDDIIKEITKMEDYCRRWRMYESFLREQENDQSQ